MLKVRIAIIGGGLSGVYAASLLEQVGISNYALLEARNSLGGRILSPLASDQAHPAQSDAYGIDRVDLGPTWFWPAYNHELYFLIQKLNLVRFEQHIAGDMLFERSPGAGTMRSRGHPEAEKAMRLAGGMGALVHALQAKLNPDRIHLGQSIRHLRIMESAVELESTDAAGNLTRMQAEQVLLAVPPRLAIEHIEFTPALPAFTRKQWSATATWMAPHAKYVATYETPFWRDRGLSGEARSALGPLGEIHDASMPGGHAALFGFLGIPAIVRQTASKEMLKVHCRAQLSRLFGPKAATPVADWIKDWATDPLTATPADLHGGAGMHAAAPATTPKDSPWDGLLTGIASEWSRDFPGYVAGAIDAARQGVVALVA